MEGENTVCANCGGSGHVNCGGKSCGCIHHKVMPVLVVLFGLILLAWRLNWITVETATILIPILIIIVGIKKLVSKMCKCC